MTIETMEYKLKSIPEKEIVVPVEGAKKAESLIKLITKGNLDFDGVMKVVKPYENDYSDLGLDCAFGLYEANPQTQRFKRKYDEVYLRVCGQEAQNIMKSKDLNERMVAERMFKEIYNLVDMDL